MIQLYPERAADALEFDKIRLHLHKKCRTDAAHERVDGMRFHTRLEYVKKELQQTHEYKMLLSSSDYFPNDFTTNVQKELKLLSIPRSVLGGEQLLDFKKLAVNMKDILVWFSKHEGLYDQLREICAHVTYDKSITELITSVIDDTGQVRDNASRELMSIRSELTAKRQQLRKIFEGILRKLNKEGYLADIAESFLNGRRTVAVFAEHKRIVKGILHGESDSQRTVFIEPEATIELNNEVFSLERAEAKEIQRILADTTEQLSVHHPQLETYYHISGLYDFIRAKALFAQDINGNLPRLSPHPEMELIK
ncbi:MAG TPA: DNA mismatch repair protein MutS, partial [Flavipsychrobacter sp.]|nr:DNA mismatch repair protein MutS [Flavipsychrobacter sp.]